MIRQVRNYLERVKNIHDNPFWATNQSRAARTSTIKSLWRGFAGYALLLMLPLGLITNYLVQMGGLVAPEECHQLALVVSVLGVVQLLYLSVKAALSTAPSVVQARQQGTLLALALTRINSADFADGVALSESKTLVREFLVWVPAVGLVTWMSGQSIYSTLILTVVSALCVLYFTYHGIYISATSKDTQEAGRRASQGTLLTMGGTCVGFLFGGFFLGPLWLLHPVFAYLCSMWGAGSPTGPALSDGGMMLLCWCGWSLFVLPVYLWMVLGVRKSAIRALERVRIG